VKMVDFGISKVREATTQLTLEQAILGTPQYMAPEQALGRLSEISDRTDQFALAAITYELLTGRPAFAADSVPSILFQVVHQQPDPITKLAPTVGRTVEAVVFKALSKAQEDRYPSVLSFHAALVQAATADYPISPMDTPAPVWLPQGSSHGVPGNASGGLSLVAPTAELQPVAATALLEPTSQKVLPTTLRAAAASFESEPVRKASSRRWPIWTSALVVAAGLAGLGTWQVSRSRLLASPFPVIEPRAKVTPPAPTAARIDIKNAPPGLIVSIDGVVTDLPILLPAGYDVHTIFFEAPGYKSTEMHVDGSEPRALVLAMKPVSATDQPMADDETASSARKTHARKAHKSAHRSQ
jgi:serine/threonine-protein kinase